MSAARELRQRTQSCHEAVDAAFGVYNLTDRASYARMLRAHARALVPAEGALAAWPGLPAWRPRAGLIAADLAGLGEAMPEAPAFALGDEAAAWGALYVLEGSRLGNAMLVRGVPVGWPAAYMGARHESGGWRALLGAIDARCGGADWLDRAVAGAEATFGLYLAAVQA